MLHLQNKIIPLFIALVCIWATGLHTLAAQDKDTLEKLEDSKEIFGEILDISEKGIPPAMMEKAGGIMIVPDMYKAGFVIGGRRGKGIAMVQDENGTWSQPAFVTLTGGSFGLQLGVQKIDLILVFRDAESLREIGKTDFTLGGDISVAAGPVGRQSSAATNFTFDSAVYSYSKTKGVFAGVSLDGTLVEVDSKSNRRFYETEEITAQEIFDLNGSRHQLVTEIHQLLKKSKERAE